MKSRIVSLCVNSIGSQAVLVLLWLCLPCVAWADCSMTDDGDCCRSDSDCVAFVHEALCIVMPLNRPVAEEIGKQISGRQSGCGEETIKELKAQAAGSRVKCVDSACEMSEDEEQAK